MSNKQVALVAQEEEINKSYYLTKYLNNEKENVPSKPVPGIKSGLPEQDSSRIIFALMPSDNVVSE